MEVRRIRILQKSENELNFWEKAILGKFTERLENKGSPFPCIPATIGHSLDHFSYGFVSDPRKNESFGELAALLKEYTETSRHLGNFTSLIIFFETPAEMGKKYSVEDYEQLFWKQLNGLLQLDAQDWPKHIPVEPANPDWEFCFHGEQYFMYCATPAHKNRQSRYFPCFMLAITPRWVLTQFNSSPATARKIKAQIRKRLENYDSCPIHPDLNSYGKEDNFEWKQYFLREDESTLRECPFHKIKKKLNPTKNNDIP
jgi:uncharacterized protein